MYKGKPGSFIVSWTQSTSPLFLNFSDKSSLSSLKLSAASTGRKF